MAAAALMGVLLLAVTAAGAAAQQTRQLTAGTPVTAVLDTGTFAQVFTFSADEAQSIAITATNTLGVPLAITVTDAAGAQIAQAIDGDTDGEVLVRAELPGEGVYYLTAFKAAGVNAVNTLTFTLVADVVTGETLPEPTAAPTADPATAEATPTADPAATAEAAETAAATAETTATAETAASQLLTTLGFSITLDWASTDDLDLEVRDPVGGSLYWRTPTVTSGGTISPNVNQACAAPVNPAQEVATWSPGGIPTGSYELIVYFQQSCNNNAPASFTLTPTLDGRVTQPVTASALPGQTFVTAFEVAADGTASFTGLTGIEGEQTLPAPAAQLLADAVPVEVNTTLTGTITNDATYQAYQIDVPQNELLTISMEATSGSLDTFVALLDASGSIIRSNDDREPGFTNALITQALVTQAGTYTIVATRYAKSVGGTEGDYTLTIATEPSNLPAEFASLPRGSIEVRLLWRTNADLQLLVRDAAGDAVFDDIPTIRSGGTLAAQGNVNCRVSEGTPFSYIYWPLEVIPRSGSYEVEVWYQNDCGDTTPVSFNLSIAVNGQEVFSDTASPLPNDRYLTSFTINVDGTARPSEGGIITGLASLNYLPELATATQILPNEPLGGSITADNKFDVFVFLGQSGDVVNITMNNVSGTLDPTLYLVGPSGGLVAENDDAVAGENTNSLIADFTLPETGTYIIIATHFGALYGGTTGNYQLTLTPRS
jgi:hypothetical protein